MTCIIVDDEPIARKGMQKLVAEIPTLEPAGSFNSAEAAADFMKNNNVDLVFLDIQMPGINGMEFAKSIPQTTLVIFTTAFAEFALDSYEVDAVDYLVKPINSERFKRAVEKAAAYHALLISEEKKVVENAAPDFIFVKSDRRFFKVNLKDILFIEGLKDYVIIQLENQRIITHLNLKGIYDMLPQHVFFRINRSYIVNAEQIDSFDNNDVFIKLYEIAVGDFYRESFFKNFINKR